MGGGLVLACGCELKLRVLVALRFGENSVELADDDGMHE